MGTLLSVDLAKLSEVTYIKKASEAIKVIRKRELV